MAEPHDNGSIICFILEILSNVELFGTATT